MEILEQLDGLAAMVAASLAVIYFVGRVVARLLAWQLPLEDPQDCADLEDLLRRIAALEAEAADQARDLVDQGKAIEYLSGRLNGSRPRRG